MDLFELYVLQRNLNICSCLSDEDDIKLTIKEVFKRNVGTDNNRVQKNSETCIKLMDATTKKLLASSSSTFELLIEYSEAVAYATNDSVELGRAYGNRSAILCNAQLYEDSLKDIDRALVLNYPDNLKSKLYARKAKNLLALGPKYQSAAEQALAEAQHWMTNMSGADKNLQKNKLKKLSKQKSFKTPFKKPDYGLILPDVVDPNEQLIGASTAIELQYSKKYGRHFVATRDIKPGEVLVKTQAHLVALPFDFKYSHCWNCAKRAWAGIPCKNCVNVIFCNKKCRDEAWNNFHDIECPIFVATPLRYFADGMLMGVRVTIKAFKETGSIAALREMVEKIDSISDPLTKGFTEGKLDGSKYASIYNLTNSRSSFIETLRTRLLSISVVVVFTWATKTKVFGKKIDSLNEPTDNESLLFTAKLLFENMIICLNNGFQANFYQEEDFINTGAILSSLTSYFNHSCDPNAFVIHSGDLMGIRSTHRIIKGEQIFVSYGKRYHQLSTYDRKRKLRFNFDFECSCRACIEFWGLRSCWPSIYDQSLPFKVKANLSKAFDKFGKQFKGDDVLQMEHLITNDLRYIPSISELLNIFCEEAEYPAKEIAWQKNMLILNYRNNCY